MSFMARSLMLVSGILLALPPGWCGCLTESSCCAKAIETKPKDKPCCCCPEETDPAEPLPPKPIKSNQLCCCAKPPSVLTKAERVVPDPFAALAPSIFAPRISPPTSSLIGEVVAIDSSPSLRVLHCVWTC